jgi:hypothetical protein
MRAIADNERFEHFEHEADTQMLGMLSCMFAEPAGSEAVSTSMLRLRQNVRGVLRVFVA